MRCYYRLTWLLIPLLLWTSCAKPVLPAAQESPVVQQEDRLFEINFSGGQYGFLEVYTAPADAVEAELSLAEYGGKNAVRIAPNGNGALYLVVDAGSLLGPAAEELFEMQLTVAVQRDDGEFQAVSGIITAFSGQDRVESSDPWSVYLGNKNPNIAHAVLKEGERFVPDAHNFFLFIRKLDNAVAVGQPPSDLLITNIVFLDEAGDPLPVNPDAVFAPPAGFGEADRSNLQAVKDEIPLENAEGNSSGWGQAVALPTIKNEGKLDAALLRPGTVMTVYYTAETPPELICQSWTPGAPETSGWAKVAASAVNNTGSIAQYTYEDIVTAFGTAELSVYLDQLYIGDTGSELRVTNVSVGMGGDAQ